MSDGNTTMQVEHWLGLLRNPDSVEGIQARNALIEHTRRRMEALCRKMFFNSLKGVGVVDWEDASQESAIKLWKALEELKPKTVGEFFGLATKKTREVLLDMCRKYVRDPAQYGNGAGTSIGPDTLAKWTEFHERVKQLPDELRETFELLWYQGLTQKEVASLLAVDESTVKRRYRKARELLVDYVI